MATAFIASMMLVGCSSNQMWHLNGRSQQELNIAHMQCQNYAMQFYNQQVMSDTAYNVGYNNALIGAGIGMAMMQQAILQSAYDNCMLNFGFTKAN